MTRSKIRTSGAEGLTLSSTALTVANGLTLTDGDVTLASGHGVSFAATSDSSGSMATELLDDYEEGTWTPTATDAAVTLATASGEYTKVGRMVHVTAIITFPTTSDADVAAIGGFPFTCQNGNQYRGGFTFGYINGTENNFTFLMSGNTTEAVFHNLSGGSQAYSAHSQHLYIFSGHYPTAS
tara:strand:- start:305 stop:850 length:546 start_codon:yes stop_codon:yes gene_type:complete